MLRRNSLLVATVAALAAGGCFGIFEAAEPRAPWVPAWRTIPDAKPREWRAIVIHHSATARGNAAVFDEWHKAKGWDGLGYHFVIGNGTDSGEGEIEVGFRWREQREGAHAGNTWYNEHGIGICLVGNFEETEPSPFQLHQLVRLVLFLTEEYGIEDSAIVGHSFVRDPERGATDCPGKNFDLPVFLALLAQTREPEPR